MACFQKKILRCLTALVDIKAQKKGFSIALKTLI